MKSFVLLVVAALITDVSNGPYSAGGGSSLVGSVQSVGNASNAAFGRVGKAFGR